MESKFQAEDVVQTGAVLPAVGLKRPERGSLSLGSVLHADTAH